MVPALSPKSRYHIDGERGIRLDNNIAAWALGDNPDQGPEDCGKLHRVTVRNRVALNDTPRAASGVEERPEKVKPGDTPTEEHRGPAETRRARGISSGRGGGTIGENGDSSHTGKINRRARIKCETRSGMKAGDIPKFPAKAEVSGCPFHALGQRRIVEDRTGRPAR